MFIGLRTPSRTGWEDDDSTPGRSKWELPSPARSMSGEPASDRRYSNYDGLVSCVVHLSNSFQSCSICMVFGICGAHKVFRLVLFG